MKIMGIDIGTTTVSIVLTDTETGKQLARETVEHNSFLQSSRPEQKIQDPGRSMRSSENFSQRCRENMDCRMGLDLRDRCMGCCMWMLLEWQ